MTVSWCLSPAQLFTILTVDFKWESVCTRLLYVIWTHIHTRPVSSVTFPDTTSRLSYQNRVKCTRRHINVHMHVQTCTHTSAVTVGGWIFMAKWHQLVIKSLTHSRIHLSLRVTKQSVDFYGNHFSLYWLGVFVCDAVIGWVYRVDCCLSHTAFLATLSVCVCVNDVSLSLFMCHACCWTAEMCVCCDSSSVLVCVCVAVMWCSGDVGQVFLWR